MRAPIQSNELYITICDLKLELWDTLLFLLFLLPLSIDEDEVIPVNFPGIALIAFFVFPGGGLDLALEIERDACLAMSVQKLGTTYYLNFTEVKIIFIFRDNNITGFFYS